MKRLAMGLNPGLLAATLFAVALPAHALDPEVNLSGTFGLGLSYFRDDTAAGEITDVSVDNNASNFRITAAAHEVGVRGFIAYERGASNDRAGVEDVREFFGGITTDYGTLIYGRKATDYRLSGERLDPFYNTSLVGNRGNFASEGASYGLSSLHNGFTSNQISYRAPAFAGFAVNGVAFVNDNNSQGGDEADYGGGVSYARSDWSNLEVGIQALDINGNVVTNSPGVGRAYRLHGSLGGSLWAAGVSYEMVDVEAEAQERNYVFAAGSYQLWEKVRLAASYGKVSNTPTFDGNGFTAGAFWDFMKNLSIYGGARYVKLDNGNQDKVLTGALGVKFVFDVDL